MSEKNPSYQGLARKWRPQTFDDLVGQAHVARTLTNAIKSGRLGHGYLFTGTRGVGKTTTARLIAKAIRCEPSQNSGVPCNKCKDCVEISEGRSMDVLEIDGASNNGVDAVRELRETAQYMPSTGKYRIYIIDEVHMLTTQAFNALLKLLEEPPPHLKFIFATTDPQKIPATILSRVQRFDFKRVSPRDLGARLQQIAETEGFEIETEALHILTREAEGSMRDAVSLLDQASAGGEKKITAESLVQALGLIDRRAILNTLEAVLKRQPLKAVEAASEIYQYGGDLRVLARELLRMVRLLMVIQLLEQNGVAASQHLEVTETDLQDLQPLMNTRPSDDLDMLFCALNAGLEDLARSPVPRALLDVLLIKMASATDLTTVQSFEPELPPQVASSTKTSAPVKSPGITTAPVATPAPVVAQASAPTVKTAPVAAAPTPAAPIAAPQAAKPFNWTAVVATIKQAKPLIGSILENVSLETSAHRDGALILTLGYTKSQSFYKDQLQNKNTLDSLLPLLSQAVGGAVRLEYKEVMLSSSLEDAEQLRKEQTLKARQKAVLESEAVRAAQEVLGARLERLEIRGET
jgi:DNA polymerase-3 subunit gamma/tau